MVYNSQEEKFNIFSQGGVDSIVNWWVYDIIKFHKLSTGLWKIANLLWNVKTSLFCMYW